MSDTQIPDGTPTMPPALPQMPPPPVKTSLMKRKWFWPAVIVLVILIIVVAAKGGGGSSPTTTPSSPSAASSSTPEVSPQEPAKSSEEPTTVGGRDNSSAQAVTLGAGTFTVGVDVQPGRHVITPGKGQTGNINISSDADPLLVNEILGNALGMGVPSVTVSLDDGDEIQISNMSGVKFTPAETKLSTTLSAGNWVVGLDIPAGRYVVTPGKGMSGNLVIDDGSWFPKTNEILGSSYGVPSVTVTLAEGDNVKIMGMAEVTFKTT